MPRAEKAAEETAAQEHERLTDEALAAVDAAADAVIAAHASYERVSAECRAQGIAPPETIDMRGARAQRNPKFSGADLRDGADPRMPFRRLMKVWNSRF